MDFTFKDPASNLALDEVLLNLVEAGSESGFLRFWESKAHFVALGHGNRILQEVDEDQCKALQIPILRRISGGGTVLQGPGCFNYALALPILHDPYFASVTSTNRKIMDHHAKTLQTLCGRPVRVMGTTDLVLDNRKCSGNAQRRRQKSFLFHGTFLLDMDFSLVGKALKLPKLQPEYRYQRSHHDFLTSMKHVTRSAIRNAIMQCWEVDECGSVENGMESEVKKLVEEKYGLVDWNYKFH